jgi:polyisoprenoid-binding protein YceI
MKITNLFLAGTMLVAMASCSNNNSNKMDACSCAKITDQNSEDYKKCKELRADAAFETDYQKCKIAAASGIEDTSKVKINQGGTSAAVKSAQDGNYTIDPATSTIGWIGENVTGKKHNGNVKVKSGSFTLLNGELQGGEIIIDMRTIKNEDLAGDGQAKLESHLKSDDFFGVDKHSEAKYVIKSATKKDKIQYDIVGDLTVKGITKELKTSLIIAPNGGGASVAGAIAFDRAAFDVKYGSGKFFDNLGDQMIKDEVILKVLLKAKQAI